MATNRKIIEGTRYTQADAADRDQAADFAAALRTPDPLAHLHGLGYDCSTARVRSVGVAINDTLAAAEQLVITETKKQGMRVHRATCKRQGSLSGDLRKAAAFRPEAVKEAKAATCCKPANVPDIITAVLAAEATEVDKINARDGWRTGEMDTETALAVLAPEAAEPVVEADPALAAQEDLFDATYHVVSFTHAKHFWRAMAVHALAASPLSGGVTVTTDSKNFSVKLEGSDDAVVAAGDLIQQAWLEAYAEFKAWKKTDAAYLALPKGKEKWAAQDAYKREQEFLTAAVRQIIAVSL